MIKLSIYFFALVFAIKAKTLQRNVEVDIGNNRPKYRIEPTSSFCTGSRGQPLTFLFLVHTSPENTERREVIRQTWGTVQKESDQESKLIFVTGQHYQTKQRSQKMKSLRSPKMDVAWTKNRIALEAATHEDILQGDFIDREHMNDTLKHLLGFHWVKENCLKDDSSAPLLVIKLEDDVFVEIFHLFQFVQFVYGGQPDPKSLICDVVQSLDLKPPAPAAPTFDFCNGAAFMMTPDLIQPFLDAAAEYSSNGQKIVDNHDAFITGQLREAIGIQPLYLNPRYTYEEPSILKWLENSNGLPLPYLFAKVKSNQDKWSTVMRRLWKQTLLVHGQKD